MEPIRPIVTERLTSVWVYITASGPPFQVPTIVGTVNYPVPIQYDINQLDTDLQDIADQFCAERADRYPNQTCSYVIRELVFYNYASV